MNPRRSYVLPTIAVVAASLGLATYPPNLLLGSAQPAQGSQAPPPIERVGTIDVDPSSGPPGTRLRVANSADSMCPAEASQAEVKLDRPSGGPSLVSVVVTVVEGSFSASLTIHPGSCRAPTSSM